MGTAILKTVTNAAQDINAAQRTIGTYTNSTGNIVNVVPVVLLTGLGASLRTATYTVEYCPTSAGSVVQQLTRCQLASAPVASATAQLLDFQSLTIASGGSTFPREAMQVRPGDSLVVKVQSSSASDTAAVATVYFMDGDAVVKTTVSSELTGQNLGSGVLIELAESNENRWVRPRVDLSNWGGAASNVASIAVVIRNNDYSIILNNYTGQYNDLPDGQTTAILSASTIENIRQPFFVPAGYIMTLIISSTGTSIASVNLTAYFDVMETPSSGPSALAWIGNQGNGESPMKLNSGQKQYLTTGSTQDAFVLAAGRTTGSAVALAAPNAKMIHAEHFSSANIAFLVSDANNETANYKVWAVKFADTEVPKDTPGSIELQLVCSGAATAASGVPKDSGIASGYYLADTVTATWSAWFTAQLAALGLTPPDPFSPADDATPAALPIPLIFRFCNAIIIEFDLGTGAGANALIDLS